MLDVVSLRLKSAALTMASVEMTVWLRLLKVIFQNLGTGLLRRLILKFDSKTAKNRLVVYKKHFLEHCYLVSMALVQVPAFFCCTLLVFTC